MTPTSPIIPFASQMASQTSLLETAILPKSKVPPMILPAEVAQKPIVWAAGLDAKLRDTTVLSHAERPIAYQLRRTLEVAIANFPIHHTKTNIDCLERLTQLTRLGVHPIDLESALISKTPLIGVIVDIVVDYFSDQAFAQEMISTAYQEIPVAAESNQKRIDRAYDLLSYSVCHPSWSSEFECLSNWDLNQLAKRSQNLRTMDLDKYTKSPDLFAKAILLLKQAEQVQLVMRPEEPSELVVSALRRITSPLDSIFLKKCLKKDALFKHVRLQLNCDGWPFLQSLVNEGSSEIMTQILARSLVSANNWGFVDKIPPALLSTINWQILVENLNDDSCLDFDDKPEFAMSLFGYLRKQSSVDAHQRALTLAANSIVYNSTSRIDQIYWTGFSLEELLPALIVALAKAVSSEELYERHYLAVFETLLRISQHSYNIPTNTLQAKAALSHVAGLLKNTAFLPFEDDKLWAISLDILKLMPNDSRRSMIIANSALRQGASVNSCFSGKLPMPSEAQKSESLSVYLRNNLPKLTADTTRRIVGMIKSNHWYLTAEHSDLILSHLSPDFDLKLLDRNCFRKIISNADSSNSAHVQILTNYMLLISKHKLELEAHLNLSRGTYSGAALSRGMYSVAAQDVRVRELEKCANRLQILSDWIKK